MKKKICMGLLLVGLVLLGGTGYCCWKLPERTEEKAYQAQLALYQQIQPNSEAASLESSTAESDLLAASHQVNDQVVGWLTIPDTAIDFPVMQCQDNSYYLSHNVEGASDSYGVPFLDYRCERDFSGFQSIVYGHNIRGKRMFAGLLDFQDEDFFQSHPTGYLTTSEKRYTIVWVACLIVPKDGFVYDVVFLTEQEKSDFVAQIQEQAVQYRAPETDLTQANLVTLSTCSYEFEDARTVLIGYLVEN